VRQAETLIVSILSVDKDIMLGVKRVLLATGTISIHVLMSLPCRYQAIGKHIIVPRTAPCEG